MIVLTNLAFVSLIAEVTDQNFVDDDHDKEVANQTGIVDKIKTSVIASTRSDQVIYIVYDFSHISQVIYTCFLVLLGGPLQTVRGDRRCREY